MSEKLLRELIIELLKKRLSKEYKEIKVNPSGSPDIILSNHGFKVAVVQVETETSINSEQAVRWKQMLEDGSRLIIMIPKDEKAKMMELLWDKGMIDRVSVGTYEIAIRMP